MGFEKLRVYQAAELLDKLVNELINGAPAGNAKDIDQLRRASASVPYNIAEAYGSEHPGQKIYHLGISRGSADETRAVMRRFAARGVFSQKAIQRPSVISSAVAKMLTAWIESLSQE